MLATIKRECDDKWQPITEYGNRAYFNKYEPVTPIGRRLGNVAAGDGFKYRGRGYVQITGRANYEKFAVRMNYNLIENPDAALIQFPSYQIATIGMREGLFTGKRFADYITPAKCDYFNARRIINGTDRAANIRDNALTFESILLAARRDTI